MATMNDGSWAMPVLSIAAEANAMPNLLASVPATLTRWITPSSKCVNVMTLGVFATLALVSGATN